MEDRLLNLYLTRILSGYYYIFYNNQKYKIQYPDIHVKYEVELMTEQEFDNIKYEGWHTKESLLHQLISMGIWKPGGDDALKRMLKQIEDYKVDLYTDRLNPKKTKQTRSKIKAVQKQYNRLFAQRHAYDHTTIEGYCEVRKNEFFLINSIYDENNNLYFKQKEDFKVFNDISYQISLHTIDIGDFKKIARSDIWRNYWNANEDRIFDKPVVEWTDEQKTLVSLTKMYDNARQHMDSPEEHVYDDDDMFDGWMFFQKRKAEKEKLKQNTEKSLGGRHAKAGEVFIMAETKEEAREIYNANSDQNKAILRERSSVIKQNKDTEITDMMLPDVRRDITINNKPSGK